MACRIWNYCFQQFDGVYTTLKTCYIEPKSHISLSDWTYGGKELPITAGSKVKCWNFIIVINLVGNLKKNV